VLAQVAQAQASLAAAIGFVTQESYLFHDTILANIHYGRPSASREEVEAAATHSGGRARQGEAGLIRTGWLESQTNGNVDMNAEPGINVEAALWLASRDIVMVGADNFAIEALPFPVGTVFPVHQRLIRDHGIPLLEGMVLRPLAEAGSTAFLFVVTPLPVVGGTGSPVAPVAVL